LWKELTLGRKKEIVIKKKHPASKSGNGESEYRCEPDSLKH